MAKLAWPVDSPEQQTTGDPNEDMIAQIEIISASRRRLESVFAPYTESIFLRTQYFREMWR